jgi:hypothetical protein
MDVKMQHHAPGPSPHASTTDVAANHSLRSRRRPSPSSSAEKRFKRPAGNYVHAQATSPQVISSLIDQLSAISVPAHGHFENLLVGYTDGGSTPASASVYTTSRRNSTAGQDVMPGDQSAYLNSLREQNTLYPDDACEPPVIRTSKPPSGLSPLTAPKRKDKSHSLSSYIGRSSSSSASLHSTRSNQSATSFGNISVEAGVPSRPPGGSERSSIESKRSAKGHRSLMYMSSRERLRLNSTERKRHTTHGFEDASRSDSPRKNIAPLQPYEDTIKEEPLSTDEGKPMGADLYRFAEKHTGRSDSPRRLRINLVDGPDGESPSEKGLIPDRGSSLKHTGSPPSKSRKSRHSRASSAQEQRPANPVPEADELMDPQTVMEDKILEELEQEEDEVARRIRVLKEQKVLRDTLAGNMLTDIDTGAASPSLLRVSASPSSEPSPISAVSSAWDRRRQDPTKAHEVLGISQKAASAEPSHELVERNETRRSQSGIRATSQTRSVRHSRQRSLTVNDGDAFTLLPINYALAIQQLEESSPPSSAFARPGPPPSISVASSKESKASTTSPRGTNSAAVGGRSAVGCKVTGSALMDPNGGHKHSTSVTDSAVSLKPPPTFRSASADIGSRSHSMVISSASPPVSNSLQLQQHRTLNKKRWSHPDLSVKAEKARNDKIDRAEAAALGVGAVRRPSRSVIEERPASLDLIDIEIDNYLNSARLSQKIRHPQTGRIISFSDVGDPSGFAVFVCVGMGLTRYVMAFYDQLAATLKLRLITPDRPGIGGSQVDATGTPLSWPGTSPTPLILLLARTNESR